MWGSDNCIWDTKIRQQVQGEQGTVLWYESSSMIPFVTDRRIVELWADEKKIIGRGTIQGTIDNNFMMGCVWLLVGIGMFICADFNNILQRRKKECQGDALILPQKNGQNDGVRS